jgi:hypothetical protein
MPRTNDPPAAHAIPPAVLTAEGACRGTDPEVFFPKTNTQLAQAKAICRTCPHRQPCLDWALNHPAGLRRPRRHRARRTRRDHQDPGGPAVTDEEFDDWMREVNGDLIASIGKSTDTEAALARVKAIATSGHLACGYCVADGMTFCPLHGWTS